jgi:hypothetical protein
MKSQRINNYEVKPLNSKKVYPRTIPEPWADPISGHDEPFVFVISAKIGSGKSVMLARLLHDVYPQYFKRVYFCSANILVNDDSGLKEIKDLAYRNQFRLAQERMYTTFNDSIMEEILKDIKECKKEMKEQEKKDYNEDDYHFLIVADDVSQSFLPIKSLIVKTILKTRHLKLSLIITTQRYRNISTPIRGQITKFVCFQTQNKFEVEAIAESCDMDFEQFKKIFEYCTKNQAHSFLYIDSAKNPPVFYKNFNEIIITTEEPKK